MKNNKIMTKERYDKIQYKKNKNSGKRIMLFMCLIILLININTAFIQITNSYKGVNLNKYANGIYSKVENITSDRGIITDANDNQLAVNLNKYDLYAVLNKENKTLAGEPDFVEDPEATASKLIEVLELGSNESAVNMFNSQLTKTDVNQVEFSVYGKNLSIEQRDKIEELELPGIHFNTISSRYYPYGDFASYALGYVKLDENGNQLGELGVEQNLNGYLKGENGQEILTKDAKGIPILTEQQQMLVDKTDGTNVQLTIDAQVQTFIQSEMKKRYEKKGFDMAYIIAVDPKTGAILGMNSSPSFDPNVRDVKNYIDPFTEYCFEPGSTIKSFLLADAMEEKIWNPNNVAKTGIISNPEWGQNAKGEPNTIADWLYNEKKQSWGNLQWNKAFYFSSNTVMIDILSKLGNDKWKDTMVNNFEFGKSVQNTFMESSPCNFNPKYPLDFANTAFGQGMTSNAMQMVRAYSSFFNDGKMAEPHLIKKLTDPETNEVIYDATTDKTIIEQKTVISQETANLMMQELEQVVYFNDPSMPYGQGTAKNAGAADVRVMAKTGTAEVVKDGTYSNKNGIITSYMAAAPVGDPKVLLYSVVINPYDQKDVRYIGETVAFIANKIVNYLDKKTTNITVDKNDQNRFQVSEYVTRDLNEVKSELEGNGLKVIGLGSGSIIEQYPKKNQVISKNQTIILKGDGEVDPQVLNNKSYSEVNGICSVNNWDCNLQGIGTSFNVIGNSPVSYTIEFNEPEQFKINSE